MTRRTLLAFATWTATAAAAIGAGTAAISVLGAGITDRTVRPMTAGEVRQALAKPYSPTAAALPSPAVTVGTSTHTRDILPAPRVTVTQTVTPSIIQSISSPGGSVIVRCDHDQAYLVSWSPAQGFATGSTGRGPAQQVSVQFVAGPVQFRMTMACQAGGPVPVGGLNWNRGKHVHVPGLGDLQSPLDHYDQGGQ
jgi:hypothetical protein